MRLILILLLSYLAMAPVQAITPSNVDLYTKQLKQAEANKELPNQVEIIDVYQKALNWLNEQKKSSATAEQYQGAINNYRGLTAELEQKHENLLKELNSKLEQAKNVEISDSSAKVISDLEQNILQTNSKLLDLSRQLQQEQERLREVGESLIQLPQQQSQANKALADAENRVLNQDANAGTPLGQALLVEAQAEVAYRKTQENELALKQLSANNRQGLAQKRADILKSEYDQTENLLQVLRNQLNEYRALRQRESEQLAEELAKQNYDFPPSLKEHLQYNQVLSEELNGQAKRLDSISYEQRQITDNILDVRKALNTLREQAQWLNMSPALGEIQRAQLARLPKAPKPQQLDNEMAELRVQQLSYQDSLKKVAVFQTQFTKFKAAVDTYEAQLRAFNLENESDFTHLNQEQQQQLARKRANALNQQNQLLDILSGNTKHDDKLFSSSQVKLLEQQLNSRNELLSSLQSGSELLIVEITQLKVFNSQFTEALAEIRDAAHRYLFWVADVKPLEFSYPISVIQDLSRLVSLNTLSELSSAIISTVTSPDSLGFIIGAALLVIFGISSRHHYHAFLDRAASKVGKVTQDSFSLTLKAVFWSIIVALPLPILWGALSYGLQQAWQYPIAVAIGNGVNATLPVMWAFMISASFAHPKGLFIVHLGWSAERVTRAMRYYKLTVWLVVPLTMALITFDSLNDREFASTLGRLCFFLLCAALVLMTTNLHKAGVPLYLDKRGSGDNAANEALWGFLRYAPVVAALAAAFGYLATSQALLARLDMSVIIWFSLLIIYHIIRRSMLIQRRRIEFERAKQRRAERLAQRARSDEESGISSSNSDSGQEIEEPVVDLDTISSQSLQLVRSVLTLIALVSIIALWSEIHSAFAFLENIHLWDVTSTIQGVESSQPITLGAIFIAILVFIITAQLVRNFPSLLELTILQHLELNPGTSYAITTVSKYLLILIGTMVALSLIGVDWAKIQLLIAALGVGLGFGLQEIFANFISGLIILFEKPIRINDMVTIRELTGTITKINTRATTIVDLDRKEIIMPNKAFITEQFVNWSLSDSVTRIVISVPAEIDADPELVTQILKEAAENSFYVMDNPQPDAFLVDIQQGIQLFELRVFAAEMGHRMPLRHEIHQLILNGYHKHGLVLPFPPLQMRSDVLGRSGIVRKPMKNGEN